jgi:hypothetical protein
MENLALGNLFLKGKCHEMDIFFKRSKHFNRYCTFCEGADGFQCLSKAFHYPIQLLTFIFASLKLLTNFENVELSSKFPSL